MSVGLIQKYAQRQICRLDATVKQNMAQGYWRQTSPNGTKGLILFDIHHANKGLVPGTKNFRQQYGRLTGVSAQS